MNFTRLDRLARVGINNTSFSSQKNSNGPNKLMLHFTWLHRLAWENTVCINNTSFSSQLTNTSYKLVLLYTRLDRLARKKHSGLLDPLVIREYGPGLIFAKLLLSI